MATVLVVMGVSGAGKTTVGQALALRLGWPFKEGDDLHPPENIAKMEAGAPLTDADRTPWLAAVDAWIDSWRRSGASGVITCSALKRAYRDDLREGRPEVRFVFLRGDPAQLAARVSQRRGHFMPPSLLASQFADLEPPSQNESVFVVDIDLPLATQLEVVLEALARSVGHDDRG
jgi:gluconokinase